MTSETDPAAEPAEPADLPEGGARSTSKRRGLATLVTVVGVGLAALALFYVGRRLAHDWPEARTALEDAEYGWVAAALVLAAIGMAGIGWGWRYVLRVLGVEVPLTRLVAWYFVGELGKYLPGSVWPVLGRGELARRGGVPRTRAYASVAMSLAILYLSAMFVATAFLPFAVAGDGFSPWMLFLLALPIGVVLLHHDVLGGIVGFLSRVTGREVNLEIPAWRESLLLVVRYVPTWLAVGTSTWAVARALTPEASYPKVMFATLLGWIAGFLAVPVPSGAGIREAVLVASAGLPPGVAPATAIVSRILFVVVDVAGAGLGAPIAGARRGGATVGPLPHPERTDATDVTDAAC